MSAKIHLAKLTETEAEAVGEPHVGDAGQKEPERVEDPDDGDWS